MAVPNLFWLILTVAFGPVAGSFIAAASMRLPEGRPIGLARSACDDCGRTLGPLELVPIVSFLSLRGRCASCGAKIHRRHLAFELAGLAIGLWGALAFQGPSALITGLLGWQLLLLATLDAEHLWLPRALTGPLIVSGLLAAWMADALPARLIGAVVGFVLFRTLAFLYRRLRGRDGLGGGDAWLFAGAGAWVGWSNLPTVLVIGSISALLFALAPLVVGQKLKTDRQLPFGVFLAIGIWAAWLAN